jgi:uncharacterized protein YbjT (DUF2867 family)
MKTVTVFGGSGFVGRYVVEKLAKAGWQVKVAVRYPLETKFLKPLGNIGQIIPVGVSILDYREVLQAVQGSQAVINLVGILFERGQQTFEKVHIQGADNVARACKEAKVKRLIHMSALGADTDSPSQYAWSKGAGERHVKKFFPIATIIRPSVIFGPEDDFFNRFASMAIYSPFLPAVGGGETKFQPIYVCDVADFMVRCLEDPSTKGKAYDLGGPEVYTLREIMEYTLDTIGKNRLLVPLPFSMARFMGLFGQYLPKPPVTPDQVILLKKDNILGPRAKGLKALGVRPTHLETVVPGYLARYR